ncbi:hypothetical protein EC960932_0208, partial [Escherichia coli 96.0932]
MAGGTS